MRRFRTAFALLLVSPLCLLPGLPTGATGRLYGQDGLGCIILAPLVPFLPGPAGCAAPALVEPCDPPTPVVKIRVRVPACGKPGDAVEYRIRVDNCSAADAHHVVLKNALPPNARFVRASPEPHVKEPELQWRLGTMKAGCCCDINLVLQPTNLEDLRNCTRVAFEHGQCVTTRLAALPPPEVTPGVPPKVIPIPKTPTEKEPPPMPKADEAPKLTLTMEGPKTQYLNQATRYFITVANKGQAAATNLLVDVKLADMATFLQADNNGKHIENRVAWVLGTLEPGAIKTVMVAIKSPVVGELCHKATALADRGAKAQAEFCTMFAGVSALALEMFDTEDPIPVGGSTSYPIVIRNTGTAPVTNLRLKAIIPNTLLLTRVKGPGREPNFGEPLAGAKVLVFDPMPSLEPGAKAEYVIFVQGAKPADVRFRIELRADQLEGGPVIEEESTRVYAEEGGSSAIPLIRDMSLTLPYRP